VCRADPRLQEVYTLRPSAPGRTGYEGWLAEEKPSRYGRRLSFVLGAADDLVPRPPPPPQPHDGSPLWRQQPRRRIKNLLVGAVGKKKRPSVRTRGGQSRGITSIFTSNCPRNLTASSVQHDVRIARPSRKKLSLCFFSSVQTVVSMQRTARVSGSCLRQPSAKIGIRPRMSFP